MNVPGVQDQFVIGDRKVRLGAGSCLEKNAIHVVLNEADEKQTILSVQVGQHASEVEKDLIQTVAPNAVVQRVDSGQVLEFCSQSVIGAGRRFHEGIA